MSNWTGTLHYSLQGKSSNARTRLNGKLGGTFVAPVRPKKTARLDVRPGQADVRVIDDLIEFVKQLKKEQNKAAQSTAATPVELDHLTIILMRQ
jgi:hypothetical protein